MSAQNTSRQTISWTHILSKHFWVKYFLAKYFAWPDLIYRAHFGEITAYRELIKKVGKNWRRKKLDKFTGLKKGRWYKYSLSQD